MVSVNSLSAVNTSAFLHITPNLSDTTLRKLKELGIKITNITSEEEAKKLIAQKTEENVSSKRTAEADERFDNIYQRLKTLSMKIGVSMSSTEKIETVLNKIQSRIALFEQNNNDANLTAVRSEYDAIKYTYETLTSSKSNLFTGMDILGQTNKVLLSMRK